MSAKRGFNGFGPYFLTMRHSSRRKGGGNSRTGSQTETLDLLESHHVVNQVSELDPGRVAFHTDAALPHRLHTACQVAKHMLDPCSHFCFLAVFIFLRSGERMAAGSLLADAAFDGFVRLVTIDLGALIGAISI